MIELVFFAMENILHRGGLVEYNYVAIAHHVATNRNGLGYIVKFHIPLILESTLQGLYVCELFVFSFGLLYTYITVFIVNKRVYSYSVVVTGACCSNNGL